MSKELFDDLVTQDAAFIEWKGMPEFNQSDKSAYRQILVSFDDEDAIKRFSDLLEVHIGKKTKSIWYPHRMKNKVSDLFYYDEEEDVHSLAKEE